jgi:hypothetical protein
MSRSMSALREKQSWFFLLGFGPLRSRCRATSLPVAGPASKLGSGEVVAVARSRFGLMEAMMSHAPPMYAQQVPTTGLVAWVFIAVVLFVLPTVLALLVGNLM